MAVGLGAVSDAAPASAPAPVDVGRPSGAARFANTQRSGRVSRGSLAPSLEATVRQELESSMRCINGLAPERCLVPF